METNLHTSLAIGETHLYIWLDTIGNITVAAGYPVWNFEMNFHEVFSILEIGLDTKTSYKYETNCNCQTADNIQPPKTRTTKGG